MAIRRYVILWEQGTTHTMSERATKKRKTEQSIDVTVNKERAIELGLWFDDGNIVIIAQHTPFKVHRGFLIARSEMFRDMFALPTVPGNSNAQADMMDGVPTVHVSDHCEDDLCAIRSSALTVIKDKSELIPRNLGHRESVSLVRNP